MRAKDAYRQFIIAMISLVMGFGALYLLIFQIERDMRLHP